MPFDKIQQIELKFSVKIIGSSSDYKFPEIDSPIIAFAGRSNVGKSSIINSLAGKKIAFISKKPGKTQQINYYLVNSKYYFVDLPGYGYAEVSKKLIVAWKDLIEKFFTQHNNIKLVILIFDIRRNYHDLDRIMYEYIKQLDREFCILLNKSDKLSHQQINQQTKGYAESLGLEKGHIITFSARTGVGKRELLILLKNCLKDTKIV